MSRNIIKNKQVVTDDAWIHLKDDEALPPTGDVTVSLARWAGARDKLLAREGQIGVLLLGTDDARALEDDLGHLSLIALDFPKFADGRCYSHARILRDQLGFKGELRAVGDVLRDQIWNMSRCGIDAFELNEGKDLHDALKAFDTFSVRYQAAADESLPHYRRHKAPAAAHTPQRASAHG